MKKAIKLKENSFLNNYFRQDINEIKIFINHSNSDRTMNSTNSSLFLPSEENIEKYKSDGSLDNITDARLTAIKDEAVGEITINEIEKEIIERCLKQFKGNRRKTASALDISERTLYRKIKEYGL